MIRATPSPATSAAASAIPQINVTARLKEVKCPALVMVGEQDAGTPGRAVARDPRGAARIGAG